MNLRERDCLDGMDIVGRIILKLINKKHGGWTGLNLLRIGQVVGSCERGNEPSGSVSCGEFLG